MYKIPLQKRNILSAQQAEQLFPSLEELILFHSGLCADLKERVGPVQNEICKNIADVLLQRVSTTCEVGKLLFTMLPSLSVSLISLL